MSGGTSHFTDGQHNMSVHFRRRSDGKEVEGRLAGVAIQNFDGATDAQLLHSLTAALSPDSADED